MIKGDFKL